MRNSYFIIIILFAALVYGYNLGNTPLIDPDEPRYAEAAREMLQTGDFIVPHFNYEPRFDKPILFYWLEAASMKTFGVGEFAARLPSALAGVGMVAIAFLLGNIQGLGVLASLITFSTLQIISLSRMAITDMVLCFFISATIAFFYLGYANRHKHKREFAFKKRSGSRWLISSFICMGLGVLCKGPIVAILAILVILPFLWWQKDIKNFVSDTKGDLAAGIFLFLAITLPWYLSIHFATDGEFTRQFFIEHNFNRFAEVTNNHDGPWWFYLPTVLIGFMPWTVFLIQALFNVEVFTDPYKPNQGKIPQLLPIFCLWWAIVVLAFFTFSSTKLITYILPIYLPLAVIVAKWWSIKFQIDKFNNFKNMDALVGLVFLLVIAIAGLFLGITQVEKLTESINISLFMPIVAITAIIATSACIAMTAILQRPIVSFTFVISSMIISYIIGLQFIYQPVVTASQSGIKEFAKAIPQDARLLTYNTAKPSIVFYSERRVRIRGKEKFLEAMKNNNRTRYFITKEKLLRELNSELLDSSIPINADRDTSPFFIWDKDSRFIYGANFPRPILKPINFDDELKKAILK